ncbi:Ig-like domain-containing protein [Marinilabilia sp.]|uniref:Ig-like domain-containing protein n=1 Tax=Marinilabilia sp. TaxID=2021252 RepID=UPI0025BD8E6D|nr:Ig-like domain-containing protein [Marinilabilia sp.]
MLKNISFFVVVILLMLGFSHCANIGYPEGGPADETPPKMIRSTPPLNSTNFQGDEISLEFNELIVLKEAFQKVVVSPPLNTPPIIRGMGNRITISFEEELQPGATYTIDFADAIQDNNEGNVLEGFSFSFSTGETQDSLEVSGHVFEAFSHTPVPGVMVMAHSNLTDTALTKVVPPRVAKTNEAGEFVIRNLAEGQYRIYALEDMNRDYKFDQPGERIAWIDELVEPSFEYRDRIDSLFTDSVTLDTVLITKELIYTPDSLKLFLFQEDYKEQYLDSRERKERYRLDFFFNRSLEKPLEIEVLNAEPESDEWFVYERSLKHDSVMVWLSDTSLVSRDSLTMELIYQVKDSLNNPVDKRDTLKMFHRKVEERRRNRKDDEKDAPKAEPLRVRSPGGNLEIGSTPYFNFPTPISEVYLDSLQLSVMVDSVYQPVPFDLKQDSIRIRQFALIHEWQPGTQYQLLVDSAAFRDIYGKVNGPMKENLTVKKEDSYGILYVDASGMADNALLQVLDSKENVIRQGYLPQNGKLAFRYMKPGKYFLRMLRDINQNGQWDTGDFSDRQQPESMLYFPDVIEIRANWDQMVPWDVNEYKVYDFINRNRIKKEERKSNRR